MSKIVCPRGVAFSGISERIWAHGTISARLGVPPNNVRRGDVALPSSSASFTRPLFLTRTEMTRPKFQSLYNIAVVLDVKRITT